MIAVLGAGIAGISAAYHLGLNGQKAVVFEKDGDWGGLCGDFEVAGFRFDKAIHLSFTENEYVRKLFSESCEYFTHNPLAYNYYKGVWLKHPAQNNLAPLPSDEKVNIISDFISNKFDSEIKNYEDWLKAQYGEYFAENFPIRYTRKYWTYEAKELSTSWVGNRMYRPDIKEVLKGAFDEDTPNTYYAKEMRYPVKGGYKSFIKKMADDCSIELNKEVVNIDVTNKIVSFSDGLNLTYEHVISSLPLPEYPKLIKNMPDQVVSACNRLVWTSVGLVSIGLKRSDIPKHLWFYVYDEDIPFARCYSPSMKSPYNVPYGCSSLQLEVYYSKNRPLSFSSAELINICVNKLEKMGVIDRKDIVVSDFRCAEYGNVVFYHGMEKDRQTVLDYLESVGICTIGRFGKWDYLWSDQSLLSGGECLGNKIF
ncbi:NAD(P)/FAD-dependent oxidoreductase [Seleniivibrio woodruffii]|uniref:protoporphyrinogen/coproporphyrinogen oxidase n=1 Tax=Seleniivibrio woodruffii TaxID=1078050 RepID=UPI0026ECA857|nr:FAD-dependent oxidoreductase [Seleniivibrio woodruffii]